PGGWKATALLQTEHAAVTMVKALDQEWELPPAAMSVEFDGSHFKTESTTTAAALSGSGVSSLAVNAGPSGLRHVVVVELPEAGADAARERARGDALAGEADGAAARIALRRRRAALRAGRARCRPGGRADPRPRAAAGLLGCRAADPRRSVPAALAQRARPGQLAHATRDESRAFAGAHSHAAAGGHSRAGGHSHADAAAAAPHAALSAGVESRPARLAQPGPVRLLLDDADEAGIGG